MKKILSLFKSSVFFNLLTFSVFSFAFFEIYFYSGFIQKHFFISFNLILILYFLIAFFLFKFQKVSLSLKLINLNNILFLLFLLIYFILIFLEEYNYPNFIYGHLHINPANFIYLPLISSIIIFIYNNKYFQKIVYIIIPLFTTFLVQIVSFGNNFELYNFSSFWVIIVNYLIWSVFLFFCISLFSKKSFSYILYLIFLVLFTLVNRYKIKVLNNVLNLQDFYLINNLKSFLIPVLRQGGFIKEIIFVLLFIAFIIFLIIKLCQLKNFALKYRLSLFFITLTILLYPLYYPQTFRNKITKVPLKIDHSSSINNCKVNGLLFCFYDDFKNIRFPVPSGYNQTKINDIYSNLERNFSKSNKIKPNVIVILSEAFWDVTEIKNLNFYQDPIPFSRRDFKSSLISPVFGGATANVEFELLTAFSNNFLFNHVAYNRLINKDVPSLFSLFKEEDYFTSVVHPFTRSMYNRPSVYKHFGLDQFISMESMVAEYNGPYISDKSFTQEILKQLNSTNQPQFIFAISMQNHTPYEANRFSKNYVKFSSNLSEEEQSYLQSYVDGINLSDKYYQFLKEEIKKSNKPTIVILYGDHLPFLQNDFGIYKNLDYVPSNQSDWTKEDWSKMHTTPITLWSNFNSNLDIASTLSPNFLSLEILRLANIEPKYQFLYLNSLKDTDTILSPYFSSKFSSQQLSEYELIQYDLIFGKQYGMNQF